MRARGLLVARVLVAVAVFCAVLGAATSAFGAYAITGTVRAAVSMLPVQGIELQLWKYNPGDGSWTRPGIYAESGADGTYSLNFYDDGVYRVQAYNSDFYLEQWWLNASQASGATSITVPGSVMTGINFSLYGPTPTYASQIKASAPSSVYRYLTYKITGSILSTPIPATPAGGRVQLVFKRYYSHAWHKVGTTKNATLAAGAFKYSYKPATRGTWRCYVSYAGQSTGTAIYSKATTIYKSFKVK